MNVLDKRIELNTELSEIVSESREIIPISGNCFIDGTISMTESPLDFLVGTLDEMEADYSLDRNDRLQITVETIRNLAEILHKGDSHISLDEEASAIFRIEPNPVFFLKKWLPLADIYHEVETYSNEANGVHQRRNRRQIVFKNNCFTDSALDVLNELFSVEFHERKFAFQINKSCLENFDFSKCKYTFPDNDNGLFVYSFKANTNSSSDNDEVVEQIQKEGLLDHWECVEKVRSIFNRLFGAENVEFINLFYYKYDYVKYRTDFLLSQDYSDFYEYVSQNLVDDQTSISQQKSSIGIDFSWKENTTDDLILKVHKKCPLVDVATNWEDYRCNIEFVNNNVLLEEFETN